MQNQKRLKLMLAAFEEHNRLMAEAQDGQGTQFLHTVLLLLFIHCFGWYYCRSCWNCFSVFLICIVSKITRTTASNMT